VKCFSEIVPGICKLAIFTFHNNHIPYFCTRMKKIISYGLALLSLGSCHEPVETSNKEGKPRQLPKPGTIVASAEMPVADDLNHFTFSVKVIADSNIAHGVYDVDAGYGPNFAKGQITMPIGGEDLKPVIRKGNAPYTFIIGFRMPGDTTFYDYFEVRSSKATTKMQYLKVYTL
jgi:hypothetical protein